MLCRVYFVNFVKIIHHNFFGILGVLFLVVFFTFLIIKKKYTLKVGEGTFSSNLSYDPLFRFLVFLGGLLFSLCGCFLGFLNFRNNFLNLLKKLGRVYFLNFFFKNYPPFREGSFKKKTAIFALQGQQGGGLPKYQPP